MRGVVASFKADNYLLAATTMLDLRTSWSKYIEPSKTPFGVRLDGYPERISMAKHDNRG